MDVECWTYRRIIQFSSTFQPSQSVILEVVELLFFPVTLKCDL